MGSRLYALAAFAMFATPVSATEIHCKGNEANLRIFVGMTEVLFNHRDETQASKYYAPQAISHNADRGGSDTRPVQIAGLQQMWRNSKATWPDRVLTNDLIVCSDDIVVARTTMTGTMAGPMGNIPATGKRFTTTATDT